MPALFMPTTWNNRGNVDNGDWDSRAIAGQSVIVGSGSAVSFVILEAMNPIIVYRPRHLNYGSIVGGRDQWLERSNSDSGWGVR